jgi:hypothetical protein
VSTYTKEKIAVVKYKAEEDAEKAFECKTLLFNLSKIIICLADKVHNFEEDAKEEENKQRFLEAEKFNIKKFKNMKTLILENMTTMIKFHLEMKQASEEEGLKGRIQKQLEEVKEIMAKVKATNNLEELEAAYELKGIAPLEAKLEVVFKDNNPLDFKSLNELFKVSAFLEI